ncbi:tubulin-like doman-containing protein [Solidesulfovibrio sp.]|uniref:tubulin-like doman-containing protein n=1 Tax=Solidesulfovibrio sp. TaxID=2910990 RepID=UPI0026375EA7|nr:tubulin-like doman-containing protein [Solidesulfovibrio sp.]
MAQHNFLLIGLGGTGCAVVRELKKKLYVEWRSRGNTGESYPDVYAFHDEYGGQPVESRIATLSVDSNRADLEGQGERLQGWRVFGKTLHLKDKEKVLLNPEGLEAILGSIERYPGIEPWVRRDMDFVRDITRGTRTPNGCNQIRRMGRLALANGDNIANVIQAVADRIKELCKNGQVGAEIHVACTLAAGTGSGALLDVVAQIQRHLKDEPGSYQLFIHGFVTAKDVGSTNTGNFYANQYAALLELNAFRLGIYEPWDIRAASPARLAVPKAGNGLPTKDLRDTYKAVALLTDTTESDVDVPLAQQIENAAEFLFQVAVRQMGDLPKSLRDALTMEDRNQFPADANGGARSTAFISYGVQRVAIPEREIREKLSYSFGRQYLLRAIFNKWDKRYLESPRDFSTDSFVGKRRSIWKATRAHLCLDLVEDVTGQPEFELYEVEWRNTLEQQEKRVREQLGADKERRQWLTDFDRRADKVWQRGFRARGDAGGVLDYFKARREPNEISARAGSIRAYVERDLIFGIERLDPEYALNHLPDVVEHLSRRIEEDRTYYDEQERKAVDEVRNADRKRDEIRTQYDKCGRWAKGKQERLFNEYRIATTQYHYWQTMQHAMQYGHEFCTELLRELVYLHDQVATFNTNLKLLAERFAAEIKVRISDRKSPQDRKDVVYLVDAQYVNDSIRERFEANKEVQDRYGNLTMEALKKLRGDHATFAAYNDHMAVDEKTNLVGGLLVERLRMLSEQHAMEAHREVRENVKDFEGILGQNIVRKLYNDYGGQVEGKLAHWLRELLGKAMPMVAFHPNSEPMELPTQGPVLRRCVFLPKCAKVATFEQQMHAMIESIIGDQGNWKTIDTACQDVPEERNPTEIAILSVAFFFPARHARVTHALHSKYRDRLEQGTARDAARTSFEVHTESHNPPLPDLMKPDRKTVLAEHLPEVMLATALGLMRVPDTDGEPILFGRLDAYGRVTDKVESGMTLERLSREVAAESQSRFGLRIPVETIQIYSFYTDQFNENCLIDLQKLIRDGMAASDAPDLDALHKALKDMSGCCFLLSGKKESDAKYRLFDAKARAASTLASQLADRTRL